MYVICYILMLENTVKFDTINNYKMYKNIIIIIIIDIKYQSNLINTRL